MSKVTTAAITDAVKAKLVEHNISSPNIDTDTLAENSAGAVELVIENPPEVADGRGSGEPTNEQIDQDNAAIDLENEQIDRDNAQIDRDNAQIGGGESATA